MKLICIIVVFVLAWTSAGAQQTYVPDDNFEQALIDLGYDTPPLDNYVPTKNIDTVTILHISQKNISDLTGIEDFKELKILHCYGNELVSLDLNENTALNEIISHYNSLTSLDVSNNTALTKLICNSNKLTNLDVSNNTALIVLTCEENKITSLNVSNNTALNYLVCYQNQLSSLDVSKNPLLTTLYIAGNDITSLDVSKNELLTRLICGYNNLTSLDVTRNIALTELWASGLQLTNLDVSKNTSLRDFNCYDNPNLYCIQVSDSAKAANNTRWIKDVQAVWSEDCSLVSVEEEETYSVKDITVLPNPATDFVEINGVILNEVKDPKIKVFDVLGTKTIDELRWSADTRLRGNNIFVSSEGNIRIDISSLSPGVYFVRVGSYVAKFVKM